MRKSEAMNTFAEGMIMDLNPLVTPNNILVNCLNGTLVTFNGNENALQNDMGNSRVETAYLPEGYVPLGTCSLGGIIYIVSYNPLTNKCQIGSFPSPERNITSDELGQTAETPKIQQSDFISNDGENYLKALIKKIKLSDLTLSPGDKFKVAIDGVNDSNYITDMSGSPVNKIKLTLATIDNNGRIIKLTDLLKYKFGDIELPYQNGKIESTPGTDIDDYRSLVASDYNIYSSRIAGNLYVIAEPEIINTFDVSWEITSVEDKGENEKEYTFNFNINTTSEDAGVYLSHVKVECDKVEEASWYTADDNEKDELDLKYTLTTKTSEDGSNLVTFTFTPAMSYGRIDTLKTSITIDLDLLGSGTVTSDLWRYYMEDIQMTINTNFNYYLLSGQKISEINVFYVPYTETAITEPKDDTEIEAWKSRYTYKTLPKRKTYSGNYTIKQMFTDGSSNEELGLDQNSLYLVCIQSKVISEEEVSYKYIYHMLYTNGVYNQTYLSSSSDKNFDKVNLPLEYTVNSQLDLENLGTTISKHQPFITRSKEDDYCRGFTALQIDDTQQLSLSSGLSNTYNDTFDTNEKLTVNVDSSTFKVEVNSSASNLIDTVSGGSKDTKYIEQFVSDNKTKADLESDTIYDDLANQKVGNWLTVNVGEITSNKKVKNYSIVLQGQFFNKISGSYEEREFVAENYIAPLLHSTDDASKYGLELDIDKGKFVFLNASSIIASWNGGGQDNQGGGGAYSHMGHGILSWDDSTSKYEAEFTPEITQKEGTDREENLSAYIESQFPNYVFIPTLLCRSSSGYIHFLNSDVDYKFAREGTAGKGTNLFNNMKNSEDHKYWAVQMYMKTDKSSATLFVPLSTSFVITDEYWTVLKEKGVPLDTLGEIFADLLASLYVRRTASSKFKSQGITGFTYYNTINEELVITYQYEFSISGEAKDYIEFNGKALRELFDKFKDYLNLAEGDACCFNCEEVGNDIFNGEATQNITLTNALISDYINAVASEKIEYYVDTSETVEEPTSINPSQIYCIANGKLNELSNSSYTYTLSSKVETSNGTYSYVKGSTEMTLNNPKLLSYNAKEECVYLSEKQYRNTPKYQFCVEDHDGYNSWIERNDANLFKDYRMKDQPSVFSVSLFPD